MAPMTAMVRPKKTDLIMPDSNVPDLQRDEELGIEQVGILVDDQRGTSLPPMMPIKSPKRVSRGS